MWKLNEIYAQNICAFRELQYVIKQGVTTLIFGDNRDNESQRSNGSGKSALIECISIGITGSPLRKIKNEEIINDSSEESLIELTFTNDSIREKFVIERRLYRKGSSQIKCFIFRGDEFAAQETVQSSIDEYNKFILDKLGISRDEIYNNFILSKYKYQNFLASSDKEKKEFINRFSNGNMVDEAIARIVEDKAPVEKQYNKLELELAGTDGRIDLLKEQIEKEENGMEENARTKTEKITELEATISSKRSLIRDTAEEISLLETKVLEIDHVDTELQKLENSENTLENYLSGIQTLLSIINKGYTTDWATVINGKKDKIKAAEEELAKWDTMFKETEEKVNTMKAGYDALCSEHKSFLQESRNKAETYDKQLSDLDEKFKQVQDEITRLKSTRRSLSVAIETLNNKLAGVISCPACGFEFVVSDKGFNVEESREEAAGKEQEYKTYTSKINTSEEEIESIEHKQSEIKAEKRKIITQENEWADRVKKAEFELKGLTYEMDTVMRNHDKIAGDISQLNSDLDGILRKAFDEAFELVDEAYKSNERQKGSLNEDIKSAEGAIETIETTIRQIQEHSPTAVLESLKSSLEEYRKQSAKTLKRKNHVEEELQTLSRQEQNFIEFKTYLANTKIEALGSITNEFLENIGSDIRIKFSGYTVLKSGKVREKISVSLVRAGLDCGSFGKFSAGEAARVNLATILAMQKMINTSADTDKGLDLLVLDEILEAVDEAGLASMFAALNKLELTALIVSHGNIAESYPHVLKIIKENGESRIEPEF